MEAAADIGNNPVNKHHRFSLSMEKNKHHRFSLSMENEQADAGREGRTRLARPNSQARTGTGKYSFSLFI